jgi:hypothetical protein
VHPQLRPVVVLLERRDALGRVPLEQERRGVQSSEGRLRDATYFVASFNG